jgi:hypothetical protein
MLRPAFFKLVSVAALIVLAGFITVSAQTAQVPKYDKSSEVKVKGVIDEVTAAQDNTIHLTLKTDKGSHNVVVAPEKFLKEMDITFAKGDTIEVLGSQTTVDGVSVMLARELDHGGDVMVMRDENGKPVWVGWPK